MSSSNHSFDVKISEWYVKVSTSSIVTSSILTCSLILELSLVTLVIFMFIFSPTPLVFSWSYWVFQCMPWNFEESKVMSSAKSRSSSVVVKFHQIIDGYVCTFLFTTKSITSRNRNPDIVLPCFTPAVTWNHPYFLHLLTLHIECFI